MDTVQFLKTMLANEGMYCVFGIRASDNAPVQKFYPSIDVAAQAAKQLNANGYNAYFALATFTSGGNRRVDNIKSIKSLFLDLDCGEKKPYPTKKAAVVALQNFCKELNLPKPILVDSGRGVHVYWVLEEPVSYAEWLPVSEQLKEVTKQLGLIADPAVTADGARILRVPETNNYKDTPPNKVTVFSGETPPPTKLSAFTELLSAVVPKMPSVANLPPSTKVNGTTSALMDALIGNKQGKFKNLVLKTAKGKGCEQIKIIIKDQANISEPLWRAGLSIAKHCVDAEKAAELISKDYPDYDEDETLNKLDLIKGPYLCERFNELNPDICENCPHWGKIKSPIVLCQEIAKADDSDNVVEVEPDKVTDVASTEVVVPKYPVPYFRGKNGGVYVTMHDNKSDEPFDMLVYEHDVYVVGRVVDPQEGECIVMRLHLPNDAMREFNVPLSAATSREEFRKIISYNGLMLIGDQIGAFMVYIQTWVRELQQKFTAANARRQFGWTDDNQGFVLGDKCYTANGIMANYGSSATMQFFPAFKPKGTLEGWKQMADFYYRHDMLLHQWMMGVSFGSPLMQFIDNIPYAHLHVHSDDSGYGKTTGLMSAVSIWGNYKSLIVSQKDTKNANFNRAEIYKNIILPLDEVTNADPKLLSDFTYEASSIDARQKNRMTGGSNKERVRGEEWAFLCVSTGNASMLERIATYKRLPKAEAQRILEYRISGKKFSDSRELVEFNNLLASNWGHAGPIYITYLMQNQEEVGTMMRQAWDYLGNKYGLITENRFWLAHCTCTLVGTAIAIKLGLVRYDYQKLVGFGKQLINQNAYGEVVQNKSPQDLLVEFMNENYNNILQINSGYDLYSDEALTNFKAKETPRGHNLVARYETDTNMLYIVPKFLRVWCAKNQLNAAGLIEKLTNEMGAKEVSFRLYAGTGMNLPPSKCIALSFQYEQNKDN